MVLHHGKEFLFTSKVTDLEFFPTPTRARVIAPWHARIVAHGTCSRCIRILLYLCFLCGDQPFELLGFELAQVIFVLIRDVNNLVDDFALNIRFEFFEHAKRIALIFDERIALCYGLEPDFLAQILHAC